jgi:hypothetical protein
MNEVRAPAVRSELADVYLARIAAHLTRVSQSHDPFGHLFAIERLARAARAEWWTTQRQAERERNGR